MKFVKIIRKKLAYPYHLFFEKGYFDNPVNELRENFCFSEVSGKILVQFEFDKKKQ